MDIRLLGPVEVRVDGTSIALGATKQRALLAMLALDAGRTVTTHRLAEGLWGEQVPASAHKMVQHYVSQLRRALNGADGEIVTRGRGYELRLSGDASDVARVEQLLEGDSPQPREALRLWRGPPLADLAEEPFAAAEIRRLEELRLRALELATDEDLAAGRHRQVLADVDALVAEHPLSERLHAQRMLALYRSGRQAEALEAYRDVRRALVDEVGIEPGPELRALHARILQQDPTLDDFPPTHAEPGGLTNLPAQSRRLFGRERELEALCDMLGSDDERLVTLLGLGGTGKTRLAIAVGERMLSSFAGGVWLVTLAGVESPERIVPAIAAVLGVGDAADRPLAESVADRLRQRPTLVVLDNFEQLVAGSTVLADLLARTPGTRALVTSQLPLRLSGERLFRLEPLEPEAAVALFAERARAALPAFDLDAEREGVEAICSRVDGVPLALELAAARTAVMAPRELVARLDRSLEVLARGPRDLPERHRSLRATLEWAYALLQPEEQTVLARLSVFAGPAPLDAVEAVATSGGLDTLSGLVDASLVRRSESAADGVRYAMPEAVREFAAERLAAEGEEPGARQAHAEYVASLAAEARLWAPGRPYALRGRLRALRQEQRVALAWTRSHDPPLHLRLASALAADMTETGRTREAHHELGSALARFAVETPETGWAAVMRAYTAFSLGLHEDPDLLHRGVAALRAASDQALLAAALRTVSLIDSCAGAWGTARTAAEEAVAIEQRRGDAAGLAASLLARADVLVQTGRLEEADRTLAECAALAPALDAATFTVAAVAGDLALLREDWGEAARSYAESACASEGSGSTEQLLIDLQSLAIALVPLGDPEGAIEAAAAAVAIQALTGERGLETMADWSQRLESALVAARSAVPRDTAAEATARGHALSASERGARAQVLADAARGVVLGS